MLTEQFRKAKSPRIVLNGKNIYLYDTIKVPDKGKMIVRFGEVNSEWRQGIRLGDLCVSTDLQLTVAGKTAPGLQIWRDTSPREFEISFLAPKHCLTIYNIWDTGDGQSTSQIMGAGMEIEVSPDGTRHTYKCNDGHPELLFNHLVFSIECLSDK